MRAPPWVCAPGMIMMKFEPRELIISETDAATPAPMATETITHATPMTTPSAVSSERNLFRAIDLRPTIVMLPRRMKATRMIRFSFGNRGNGCCNPLPLHPVLLDPFVLLNAAVAHVHDSFRVLRDVRLVRDQHHCLSLVIELLEDAHDLDRGA